MQLSNRLTFSLASLIVLIALGLVFAPTSVLAHPNVDGDDTHANDGHMHPSIDISATDVDPSTDDIDVLDDDSGTETLDGNLVIKFDVTLTLEDDVAIREEDNSDIGNGTFDLSNPSTEVIVRTDRDTAVLVQSAVLGWRHIHRARCYYNAANTAKVGWNSYHYPY